MDEHRVRWWCRAITSVAAAQRTAEEEEPCKRGGEITALRCACSFRCTPSGAPRTPPRPPCDSLVLEALAVVLAHVCHLQCCEVLLRASGTVLHLNEKRKEQEKSRREETTPPMQARRHRASRASCFGELASSVASASGEVVKGACWNDNQSAHLNNDRGREAYNMFVVSTAHAHPGRVEARVEQAQAPGHPRQRSS
ncbi:hypothetical protein DFH07DRAFT_767271 [Mycena maculata]|uniref:Uncharacterized protein n=1 Tax=Mycena maculata TaxID=230809 RepID=A0AAD7JYL8_9AGAR|nr:hypothetical protein DFH07DRAFT_767271 [Mycena maculata]